MAKMHPEYREEEIDSKITGPGATAERWLYRVLRDLPETDDWDVLYFNYLSNSGKDVQTDFLIFCPGKGVVNADAKGKGYVLVNNEWKPKPEWKLENPKTHELQNTKDIDKEITDGICVFNEYVKKNYRQNWGAYGKLAVFKDTPSGLLPGYHDHYVMPEEVNRGDLRNRIEKELASHQEAQKYFTKEVYEDILTHFIKRYDLQEYLWDFYDYDRKLEEGLTTLQKNIMAGISTQELVHVTGGAGTGKTVIAIKCAQKFANDGKKVLYLCYNKTLASYVRKCLQDKRIKRLPENISVSHLDVLPKLIWNDFVPDYKDKQENDGDKKEIDWDETHKKMAGMLWDTDIPEDRKYNIILVDEAQDIGGIDLMLCGLQCLLKSKDRHLAYFSDSAQAIFCKEKWCFPEADFNGQKINEYPLNLNLRNTDCIHEKFIQYLENNTTVKSGIVPGQEPETFGDSVIQMVQRLFKEGRKPNDIAVIAYHKKTLDEIEDDGNISFTDDFDKWNDKNVLKVTDQSFKGLEANVVIIADSPDDIPGNQNELQYVAESRAKYRLYLKKKEKKPRRS